MGEMTIEQLALRAGTDADYVRRLIALGMIERREDAGPFVDSDLARVRFVLAMSGSGIPEEDLARGLRAGALSIGFAELAVAEPIGLLPITHEELIAETGLSEEMYDGLRAALGTPGPREPGERVREDFAEIVRTASGAMLFGIRPPAMVRALRVGSESLRRLADLAQQIWREELEEPMLRQGATHAEMIEVTNQAAPPLQQMVYEMLLLLYKRHLEDIIFEHMVERAEEALHATGIHRAGMESPPAMAFLDLSGFTRLTEEVGDEAAAELAGTLADLATRLSAPHRGRPVKWVGDGVMFRYHDPVGAVTASLDLVDGVPAAGLPPAHVGISCGPVVARDGDFFGRTVNLASRIADRATAGEVLVTIEVARTPGLEGVRFEEVGAADLKGVARPLPLYRAVRSGS
ncbi:MAG: adenylate/guanylate cyclase domain-containing protein [Actinobacteria bacterium]|nr:adenylate/guanylate cyclase domain-containing protein [Actinomycetota bacterium]